MSKHKGGRQPTWSDVCREPNTGKFAPREQCEIGKRPPCSCEHKPVSGGLGEIIGSFIGSLFFK